MAQKYTTWVNTATGNVVYLLNPARKGKKYAHELRTGKRFTNNGQPKKNKEGYHLGLNKVQRSYRCGYLQARKDNANCWKAKNKNKY